MMLFKPNAALKFCDSKIFNSSKDGWVLDCKETLLEGKGPPPRPFLSFSFYFSVDVAKRIVSVYFPFLFLPVK